MRGTRINYKGYTLKSKIEYAWARHFDANKFDWTYEPIKFRGRRIGVYTPDFKLNACNLFIETKPYNGGTMNDFALCTAPLLIIFGAPERHYIRFKPADQDTFDPGHWNHFDAAFIYATARPSWLERLP